MFSITTTRSERKFILHIITFCVFIEYNTIASVIVFFRDTQSNLDPHKRGQHVTLKFAIDSIFTEIKEEFPLILY